MRARKPWSAAVMVTVTLAMAATSATLLAACVRIDAGRPVAAPAEPLPAGTVLPTARPAPGAAAPSCPAAITPPVSVIATVPDAGAPVVTVGVPTGWGFTAGAGPVGVSMSGPDGSTARVTIAPAGPDPAVALGRAADEAAAGAPPDAVRRTPAPACGYSGVALTVSPAPDDPATGAGAAPGTLLSARLLHVWTGTADYLVAVTVRTTVASAGTAAVIDRGLGIAVP